IYLRTGVGRMNSEEIIQALGYEVSETELKQIGHIDADLVRKLLETYREYSVLIRLKSELLTQIARLNYELYETYMDVHITAIRISGLLSILRLSNVNIPDDVLESANRIMDGYLMISISGDRKDS
ncbi:MAG TPA: hypothetical protein VKU79_01025, partial [Thermoplasmataceae archaeon]|nr:hypothetical protein [Thermoplasmataceae archaeon]